MNLRLFLRAGKSFLLVLETAEACGRFGLINGIAGCSIRVTLQSALSSSFCCLCGKHFYVLHLSHLLGQKFTIIRVKFNVLCKNAEKSCKNAEIHCFIDIIYITLFILQNLDDNIPPSGDVE